MFNKENNEAQYVIFVQSDLNHWACEKYKIKVCVCKKTAVLCKWGRKYLWQFLTCFERQSRHCIIIYVLRNWFVLLMNHLQAESQCHEDMRHRFIRDKRHLNVEMEDQKTNECADTTDSPILVLVNKAYCITVYLLKLALLAHNEAFIFDINLYALFLHPGQSGISKPMLIKNFVLYMWFLKQAL